MTSGARAPPEAGVLEEHLERGRALKRALYDAPKDDLAREAADRGLGEALDVVRSTRGGARAAAAEALAAVAASPTSLHRRRLEPPSKLAVARRRVPAMQARARSFTQCRRRGGGDGGAPVTAEISPLTADAQGRANHERGARTDRREQPPQVEASIVAGRRARPQRRQPPPGARAVPQMQARRVNRPRRRQRTATRPRKITSARASARGRRAASRAPAVDCVTAPRVAAALPAPRSCEREHGAEGREARARPRARSAERSRWRPSVLRPPR